MVRIILRPELPLTKETILADNLRSTRAIIDQYYGDTGKFPDSLEQLVEKKYLRAVPIDPITEKSDSWVIVPPDDVTKGSVADIKSGAPGNDRSGKPYSEW